MANAVEYTWTVFCETEGANKIVKGQKFRPTACPTDAGHTIDVNKTSFELSMVKPVLQDPSRRTGFYTAKGCSFACTGSTSTTYDLVFPYDIVLIDGYLLIEDENQGDEIDVIVAPNLLVGGVTAPASTGDTVLNISSTAVANISKSCKVNIGSDQYTVISEDVMNSQITLTPALITGYAPGTLIYRNSYIVQDLTLPSKRNISLGVNNTFPTYIPAGYSFQVVYTNKTASDKQFNFYIEHY